MHIERRTHGEFEREVNRKQSSWFISAKSFRLFLFPPYDCVCVCMRVCLLVRIPKWFWKKLVVLEKYANASVWCAQFFRSLEYIIALCIRLNAAEDEKKWWKCVIDNTFLSSASRHTHTHDPRTHAGMNAKNVTPMLCVRGTHSNRIRWKREEIHNSSACKWFSLSYTHTVQCSFVDYFFFCSAKRFLSIRSQCLNVCNWFFFRSAHGA